MADFDPTSARAGAFDPSTAAPAPPQQAAPQQPNPQNTPPSQQGGGIGDTMLSLLKSTADATWTAAHSAADAGTFGLADKASAALASGISPLTGQPMSYDEAYQRIQQNNQAMAGRNPVSAAVGNVAGTVIGAGKIAKAARLIPGVGAAVDALAPTEGAPITNVLKSAATGGAASAGYTAADEEIRNGSVNAGDVVTNGLIGAAVAPAVTKIGTAIAAGVQNSSTKAMTLLAPKLGMNADDLQTAFDNFNAATGRVPTMAELVGMKGTGELSQLASKNPIIQSAVNDAADTAGNQRMRSLSQVIQDNQGGTPADSVKALSDARTANMNTAMDPIRNSAVGIDTTDVGLLQDPRTISAVRATKDPVLRQNVQDAIQDVTDHGQSDTLTVGDIDSIRQSLRSQQANLANTQSGTGNSVAARTLGNHIDNLTALGTSAEPAYQDALDQFGRDSNFIQGFKHGSAGKTIEEAGTQKLQQALDTPEGVQGHQAGISSRTSMAAADSPQGAVKVANDLANGGGDSTTLRGAVGQDNFGRIQDAAAAESKGASNLAQISGQVKPQDTGISGSHALQAGAATLAHSPAAIVSHAARIIPSFTKMSTAQQNVVAKYLADPTMTQQGINILRKAGAKTDEIRNLAVALGAVSGANTANALQP